mgnify:CR=1 FL=1
MKIILFILLISKNTLASDLRSDFCLSVFTAFIKQMHPVLVKNCKSCHDGSQGLLAHSAENPEIAYTASLKVINFIQLSESKFYKKILQKHWLEEDPSSTGMLPEEFERAAKSWWLEGQNACVSSYRHSTTEKICLLHYLKETLDLFR